MNDFASRLDIAIGAEPVNRFAKRCEGVSESLLRSYLSGVTKPGLEKVVSIARAANVSIDWLATGEGERLRSAQRPATVDHGQAEARQYSMGPQSALGLALERMDEPFQPGAGMVAIPRLEVVASAGHGAVVVGEQAIDLVWFNESWLRRQVRYNVHDLAVLEVTGESMEPTLRSGELVLVDHSESGQRPGDGIYVCRLEGDILVKRLQRKPGNVVKVSADNPSYDPFDVQLSDGVDFAILGRVVVALGLRHV